MRDERQPERDAREAAGGGNPEVRYEFGVIDSDGTMAYRPIAKPARARKARATKAVTKKTTAARRTRLR